MQISCIAISNQKIYCKRLCCVISCRVVLVLVLVLTMLVNCFHVVDICILGAQLSVLLLSKVTEYFSMTDTACMTSYTLDSFAPFSSTFSYPLLFLLFVVQTGRSRSPPPHWLWTGEERHRRLGCRRRYQDFLRHTRIPRTGDTREQGTRERGWLVGSGHAGVWGDSKNTTQLNTTQRSAPQSLFIC